MQRDYKTGLIAGLVLAGAAMIWVATRPSLSPEARMLRSSQAASHDLGVRLADRGPGRTGGDNSPVKTDASLGSIIDSQPKNTDLPGPKTQSPARNPQSAVPASQSDGVPDLTIYEKAEKIKTTRFHIVRREETLSAISRQYYGTPNQWQKIVEANKGAIKDPSKLQPGTKLIIPE